MIMYVYIENICDMDVSKNRGAPKWMLYNGKPYSNGFFFGYHYFWKHPYTYIYIYMIYDHYYGARYEM